RDRDRRQRRQRSARRHGRPAPRRRRGRCRRRRGGLPGGAGAMRAPARIGLYAAGLGVVFAASAAVAGAVVPEGAAPAPAASHAPDQHVATSDDPEQESTRGTDMTRGLSLEQDGYTLGQITAPGSVGEAGE